MKTGAFLTLILLVCSFNLAATSTSERLRGTLVVAVPLKEGLVTCADKRLFNVETRSFTDNNIKIRKVSDKVLFVATSTVGFYDDTKKKIVFDAFDVTSNYASQNKFGGVFWDGLKAEIRKKLREYFGSRDYSEWPETDKANNNLLFNLIFYSIEQATPRSYTLQVYYEKKRTPVITIAGPLNENIRSPKLNGKGRELMAYLDRNPTLASDPAILRFDERKFDIEQATLNDATDFSRKLFRLMSMGIPEAQVSSTFDCAMLSYQQGFRWIEGGPQPDNKL
ncbi:MAG TPA: hypothetical protein VJV05_01580 [Pyrinomonadaceae bacterium]|nr:hypothetical protein [Pyrinomonadaceae bacterium]